MSGRQAGGESTRAGANNDNVPVSQTVEIEIGIEFCDFEICDLFVHEIREVQATIFIWFLLML